MAAVYDSILGIVGDTPLVRLSRIDARDDDDRPESRRAILWGKCEQLEPAGSVKDRIAVAILDEARASGRLPEGGTVIEPTSGNTGVALAMACAVKGYRCILTMPASMSLERRQLLEAFGAEVVLTEPEQQMAGAIAKAEELAREMPSAYLPRQFENPQNPRIHAETTAREIVAAMHDRGIQHIDSLVATLGTGGTVTGLGRALRPGHCRRIVAVEPSRCATVSRGERGPTKIQGIGAGFVPPVFDRSVVDDVATVDDDDAYRLMRALARREGLLLGISSGAGVHVALQEAERLGPGHHVVVILCDTGERYFSLAEHFQHVPEEPNWWA